MIRSDFVAVAAATPMITTVASPADPPAMATAALIAGLAVLGTRRQVYAYSAVLATAAALAIADTTVASALVAGLGAALYSTVCRHSSRLGQSRPWVARAAGSAIACGVVAAVCAAGPRLPVLALLAPATVLATVAATLRVSRLDSAGTDQRDVSGADHAVSERPLSKPGG
ncbi:hypothetical protein IU421_12715 [Nocardia cyriacigeorgica]|uniref:hypothetical protein n=1 Tax=Nocardia cyriacigeorgica TaxID=135487 RepID=UPI001895811B|nr:hypothetical protein [Nocardia cyriacigeorgica]MBF6159606.1 hypothetical protein [Nocardia cyriacigeorgica]MBF6198689.1 hypothetical protein [Nocardia cyriacigeorgica]MBF6515143.1 hypothetical protein [Nocardia cyriacigeorgica]